MDTSDPKPLRLHKVSEAEYEHAQRLKRERLERERDAKQLGCIGCVLALLVTMTFWLIALDAGYDLFEWLRY